MGGRRWRAEALSQEGELRGCRGWSSTRERKGIEKTDATDSAAAWMTCSGELWWHKGMDRDVKGESS